MDNLLRMTAIPSRTHEEHCIFSEDDQNLQLVGRWGKTPIESRLP